MPEVQCATAARDGALVIDIGHDPARPGDTGPFYGVERRSLYKNWTSDGVTVVQHNPGF